MGSVCLPNFLYTDIKIIFLNLKSVKFKKVEKSVKCKCLQTFEGTIGSVCPPNLIYTDIRIIFLNLKSVTLKKGRKKWKM